MRVISGKARGTKLDTIESLKTRPTLDRVKESLFNIIQFDIKNKNVLDLFAGSGALGIESLSRGANKAYFCDINKECIKIIKKNLEKTNMIDKSILINENYEKCIYEIKNEKIDLIFLDPPYKQDLIGKSLNLILKEDILANNGKIVVETDEEKRDLEEIEKFDKKLEIYDKRKYGRVTLIFIKGVE